MIDKGASIEAVDGFGRSSLHKAILSKNAELVSILISRGANINKKDGEGMSPLHFSVLSTEKICNILLSNKNIDPNVQNNLAYTPLHIAIEHDQVAIGKQIAAKSNINISNKLGETPIHLAIKKRSVDFFNILIENKNLDLSKSDKNKQTPLHLAVEYHPNFIGALLEKKADVSLKNRDGLPPLYLAIIKSDIESVKQLIKTNINIHSIPIIHFAAEKSSPKMLEFLVNQFPEKVILQDKRGNTPLHKATISNNKSNVKILISNDGNINMPNETLNTPLHIAAANDFLEILQLLVSYKNIDPNLQDSNGNTAIHKAASFEKCGALEILAPISNLEIENNEGETPLKLAFKKSKSRSVAILVSHKANTNSVGNIKEKIFISINQNDQKLLETLLSLNVDINQTNNENITPLYLAIKLGRTKIVSILLKSKNIDINKPSTLLSETPIFAAIRYSRYESGRELVRKCDINHQNKEGDTPLHLAIQSSNLKMVELLLDNHALANIKNRDGNSPKDIIKLEKKRENCNSLSLLKISKALECI